MTSITSRMGTEKGFIVVLTMCCGGCGQIRLRRNINLFVARCLTCFVLFSVDCGNGRLEGQVDSGKYNLACQGIIRQWLQNSLQDPNCDLGT